MRHRSLALLWLWPGLALAAPVDLPEGPVVVDLTVGRPGPHPVAAAREVVRLVFAGDPPTELRLTDAGLTLTRGQTTERAPGPGLPLRGATGAVRLALLERRTIILHDTRPVAVFGPVTGRHLTLEATGPTAAVDDVQPLEPVFATDDFLRRPEDLGAWRPVAGNWRIEEYRDPLVARYGLAPQATWFTGAATERPAVALLGPTCWTDYGFAAHVRRRSGRAGLIVAWQNEARYRRLELDEKGVRLVDVSPRGEQILSSAACPADTGEWVRLELQCSGPVARALLNDRELFCLSGGASYLGAAGLWCEGRADFDNARAEPVELGQFSEPPAGWAVALPLTDGEVTCQVTPGSRTAGLQLRLGPHSSFAFVLDARASEWRLSDWEGHLLDRGQWSATNRSQRLTLRRAGPRLSGELGDRELFRRYLGAEPAEVAPVAEPSATCRELVVVNRVAGPAAELLALDFNETTVPGKQKDEKWRVLGDLLRVGRRGWRLPDPQADDGGQLVGQAGERPAEVWTEPIPGDAGLRVTLNSLSPDGELDLALSGPEGYRLRLTPTGATLLRGQASLTRELTAPPALVRFWRDRAYVSADIDGQLLWWADPAPAPSGPVGLLLNRGAAAVGELTVTAENAVASHFNVIDSRWREAGRWLWNTGMACIAWSYWITADARQQPAWLWQRETFPGDLNIRFHVSEYTDGYDSKENDRDHEHFPYHDLGLILDGDGENPDSGYRFLIGAEGGRGVRLYRRGEVVAVDKTFRVRMDGHANDPRSIEVAATRTGGRLRLTLNGRLSIDYSDPRPLAGEGAVALGATGCRANFSDFQALRPALGDGS